MVELLLIVDGATDAADDRLSCLRAADTPELDRLRSGGTVSWLDLLDAGVPVGSETAIASLLGFRPPAGVDRGLVEAAARGLEPSGGQHVWRVDFDSVTRRDRVLVFGPAGEPPAPSAPHATVRVWPTGLRPPRILSHATVVVGAPGAATGLGALMGAQIITPAGADGLPDSDLQGKLAAARDAVRAGTTRVVVHAGGADMAGHARDRDAKIAFLARADRELVGPLHELVAAVGGRLRVCTDHGCDPVTGHHVGGPVPALDWIAAG